MDYREAGVDVQAGRTFVNNIKDLVAQTTRPEVLGGLGGFNGCLLYTSPSPRDLSTSRMPSSA